jgi:hypothetical protein
MGFEATERGKNLIASFVELVGGAIMYLMLCSTVTVASRLSKVAKKSLIMASRRTSSRSNCQRRSMVLKLVRFRSYRLPSLEFSVPWIHWTNELIYLKLGPELAPGQANYKAWPRLLKLIRAHPGWAYPYPSQKEVL